MENFAVSVLWAIGVLAVAGAFAVLYTGYLALVLVLWPFKGLLRRLGR